MSDDSRASPSIGLQSSIRSFFKPRTPTYTPPPPPPAPPLLPKTSPITTAQKPVYLPSPAPSASTLNAPPPPTQALPPQVAISLIQEQHVQPLRRINSLLLPIHYPDSFYHTILAPSPRPSFSRVIQWGDPDATPSELKVIGGIICRLEPTLAPESTPSVPIAVPGCFDIYIQSLALLSPYRSKGLAAAALNDVVLAATSTALSAGGFRIAEIYAHVWTENTEALEWYAKRGFKREDQPVVGYYRRLTPDSAWILRRRILASDHLQSQSTNSQASKNGTTLSTLSSPAPEGTSPALSISRPMAELGEKRPPGSTTPNHARSFQERGPDREWNDLPNDILDNTLLKPQSYMESAESSQPSSRSSSQGRAAGKKKRVYPAAAFGS